MGNIMPFWGWQLDALDFVSPIGLCTWCEQPGCDTHYNGEPFHRECYDKWIAEYNAYLDATEDGFNHLHDRRAT